MLLAQFFFNIIYVICADVKPKMATIVDLYGRINNTIKVEGGGLYLIKI
jgi:hypothetical protein